MPSITRRALAALVCGSLGLAGQAAAVTYHFGAGDADPSIKANADDRFGATLLVADVDDDGQDDLIVAGPRAGEDRVYVFFGPLPPGSSPDPGAADVIIEGAPGGEAGWSLAAGDFDADGAADLAVGAPSELNGAGRVHIFAGPLPSGTSLTILDASSTIVGDPQAGQPYTGWSLAAGDFDGDGIDELAVGACGYDSSNGRSYLFDVAAGSQDAADAAVVFKGGGKGGCSMANVGDFDGDGFTDLVIGGYGLRGPLLEAFSGAVYIVYGRSAFEESYDLLGGDPIDDDIARIRGHEWGQNFGYAISGAGDVNGDGYDDMLVGAPAFQCWNCQPTDVSRAYLILGGKSTGPGTDRVLHGQSLADDIFDEAYLSNDPGDRVGFSVAGTGWVGPELSRYNHPLAPMPLYGTTYLFGSARNRAVLAVYGPEMLGLGASYWCESNPELGYFECFIDSPDVQRRREYDLGLLIDANGDPTTTTLRVFDGDPNDNLAFGARVHGGGDLSGNGLDDVVIADPDHIDFQDDGGANAAVYLYEGR